MPHANSPASNHINTTQIKFDFKTQEHFLQYLFSIKFLVLKELTAKRWHQGQEPGGFSHWLGIRICDCLLGCFFAIAISGFSSELKEYKFKNWVYFEQIIVKSTQFGPNWVLFYWKRYTDWAKNWYRLSGFSSELKEYKFKNWVYFEQIIVKSTQFGPNWVLFYWKRYTDWAKNWYRESLIFVVWQAGTSTYNFDKSNPPRDKSSDTMTAKMMWTQRENWLEDLCIMHIPSPRHAK